MDLLHLVDRLEELVAEAQKMPIGNRAIIDRRRLLDLVDQMRVSVPQEVREAQELVENRERLRQETEEESRMIIARAEEEVARRVDEHELTEAARERALLIAGEGEVRLEERARQAHEDIQRRIEESRHLARQQMQAADEYARELLTRLERQLQAFIGSVSTGLEQLEPERGLPPPPTPGEFDPGPVEPGNFDTGDAFDSLPEGEAAVAEDFTVRPAAPAVAAEQPATYESESAPSRNPDAIELPATAADREAMAWTETGNPPGGASASPAPGVRSGFGLAPEPAAAATPSGELEDLLGRARETAEAAALEAAIESEIEIDESAVIDDFTNPPLDDDPLHSADLEADRQAEEHASRGNGER
jgi:hypothetical protein